MYFFMWFQKRRTNDYPSGFGVKLATRRGRSGWVNARKVENRHIGTEIMQYKGSSDLPLFGWKFLQYFADILASSEFGCVVSVDQNISE